MIVGAAIGGVLIGKLVPVLVEQGLLPPGLFWWVIPFSIVSVILVIDASRFWSWGYLVGVLIGLFMFIPAFLDAGLIGSFDILLYAGLTIGAIALRVRIHSSDY